jgi:hypothetical protein
LRDFLIRVNDLRFARATEHTISAADETQIRDLAKQILRAPGHAGLEVWEGGVRLFTLGRPPKAPAGTSAPPPAASCRTDLFEAAMAVLDAAIAETDPVARTALMERARRQFRESMCAGPSPGDLTAGAA